MYLLNFQLQNESALTAHDLLRRYFSHYSEEEFTQWLGTNEIQCNAKAITLETRLPCEGALQVVMADHWEQPVDTQWEVIWQDSEILALFKPAPLAVSRTTRNLHDTLIATVRRATPYYSAQLLHRLDIETSGLILLAKDSAADKKWKPLLSQLIERKMYHAIVSGVPTWHEYDMKCQLAEREDSQIRCKMHVVDPIIDSAMYRKPKSSHSHFKLLQSDGKRSLIQCELFTGRKHQLRAHLAHLGHPIIGDKIYSHQGKYFLKRWHSENGLTTEDIAQLGSENHLLRAVALKLNINSQVIDIKCEELTL